MASQEFEKDWSFDHWAYLNGKPNVVADFKSVPEDFVVTEQLGFEPTGTGENLFLLIEKRQINTQQVCEYLAKFFKKRLRDIGYAGLKDKQSISRQWFSLQMNVKQEIDLTGLDNENIRVLRHTRHAKKLKVGALVGNTFTIRLRNVTNVNELEQRLTVAKHSGVPNYFGEQRFGFKGNNLNFANRWSSGEEIKNKKLRSFALSAARSYMFNQVVSDRIASKCFDTPVPGEVFILSGSQSYFVEELSPDIQARLASRDIVLSAPLFGDGELVSEGVVQLLEQKVADAHEKWLSLLSGQGLKQERRMLHLVPNGLDWRVEGTDVQISFELPTGCFATAVLRECCVLKQGEE